MAMSGREREACLAGAHVAVVAVADGDVRGPLLVPVESTAEATPDIIAIRMLPER